MQILPEIELGADTHQAIQELRNASFPDAAVTRSYYKQLPHYRALHYEDEQLIGHAGLDYRMVNVGGEAVKVLGVICFCVKEDRRGQGIGTSMLEQLLNYAAIRDVDFMMLISDSDAFYIRHGFQRVKAHSAWLRINEHKNYGIPHEYIDDLFVKPVGGKEWPAGYVDWLGYMF